MVSSETFTISTNPFVTTATVTGQTITISNQMVQPYSVSSTASNTTTTTIYTEQPLVTTNYTYNVTISVDYMGDPSNLFLLQPQQDWFHDDSANVVVDSRGLLSSINASNTDQTGNAIVALAQAGVQSFELAGGIPAGTGISTVTTEELNKNTQELLKTLQSTNIPPDIKEYILQLYHQAYPVRKTPFKPIFPQRIDLSFNPFDPVEFNAASNELRNAGLTIVHPEVFLQRSHQPDYRLWFKTPKKGVGGIFYRPPIAYTLSLRDSVSNVVSATVLLPNQSPILHLEMDKAPFVSAVSQVTLTNGFISSYSFSKPSSFMALATYPLVLLSDITSSLTNLIQFRINLATGQNTLQGLNNSNQAQLSSAAIAQQNAMIAQMSNAITYFNLVQNYKALTNSASGTSTH